jgi:hypothetical protein
MKRNSETLLVTTWLCIGMLLSGCSYPLAVKNIDSYRASAISSLNKFLKIGIVTDTNEPEK